ncbi:AN1-type zinc finger protein 1-like [Oppia nitens]|uniref:AN1-type zinc finger protein 1-like n=1 Tax=Oppia nitens TaxID=1686743 RepID=UPI0023DBC636|nr:AN1-type zinc finger protein 1-like [Oppia nitens]
MSEFPDLGQQCYQCKRLDFLPLICLSCKEVFCKEHYSVVTHSCPKYDTKEVKPVATGGHRTILGKCCYCVESVPDTELVLCDKCNDKHCLAHRYYDSHKCKHNTTANVKSNVIQFVNKSTISSTPPQIKGTKNEGLARRVALMKLKQTASGQTSIPVTERLYFKMRYQKSQQIQEFDIKDIFVSNEWSIGKCIDWLSTHFGLINNNNNPLEPKLVLSSDINNYESFPTSSSLKQLESEGFVQNGDTLCLKYVN